MVKIYFASNWGVSSQELTAFYKRQSPLRKGIWGEIMSVSDINDSDFVIVHDDTSDQIPDDKKVIFMGREPNHVLSRDLSKKWKNSYNFLHHEFDNCWLAQTWWLDMDYETLDNSPPNKTKNLSIIDSGRKSFVGHTKRLEIINKVIKKYPSEVDIYGKITNGKQNKQPYKTELPYKNKINGLLDYRYSLVIENGSTDYYFSEKISDSIMCWTMPIYWGCKKIHKFFPDGSFINIDINDPNIADKIMDIVNSDYMEKNIDKLVEARRLVMTKYNIWPTVDKAIKKERFF